MSLHHAILRVAALLVPPAQRAEWLEEWTAELWYVGRGATAFCLGAFRDALWVRRNGPGTEARVPPWVLESPWRCVLVLAVMAAVSVFFALRLPLPRRVLLSVPYRDAGRLSMISAFGHPRAQVPTVSLAEYRLLARRAHFRFNEVAFYRPISVPSNSGKVSIGVASANLFSVLGIPMPRTANSSAPDAGLWRLPGDVDAWLLVDAARLAEMPGGVKGFVVGRLGASAPAQPGSPWSLMVDDGQKGYVRFECSSLAEGNFVRGCLSMLPLSLFLLAMLRPLKRGEYPRTVRFRRWVFLAAKIALLVPIIACGSLDLAPLVAKNFEPQGFLLVAFIAGLRWALADQGRRCPVCLRLLAHPTRIGASSQTFLEWYGTELICAHGHGLLYVPEIPGSCYSAPRWQNLDPSWSSLFS